MELNKLTNNEILNNIQQNDVEWFTMSYTNFINFDMGCIQQKIKEYNKTPNDIIDIIIKKDEILALFEGDEWYKILCQGIPSDIDDIDGIKIGGIEAY